MNWKLAFSIVLVVLLGSLGTWFFMNFERVPSEEPFGPSAAARADPLLAARRLFARLDTSVSFQPYYRGLPPTRGTLVLLDPAALLPGDRAKVAAWVGKGGHAVIAMVTATELPELLPAGIALGDEYVPPEQVEVRLVADEALEVSFGGAFGFEAPTGEESLTQASARVLVLERGRGRITALSDLSFFENDRIGEADNGLFLWRLTHLDRDGPVWFVRGSARSSPWLPVFDRSWPLLVTLAAALLATAWAHSLRFGPLLPDPARAQPRFLDHVLASGAFSWRIGAGGVLLDAVRESVLRSIEHRRPGWLAGGDRDERIATLCDLPREEVAAAFAEDGSGGRPAFTRSISVLEAVRKRL